VGLKVRNNLNEACNKLTLCSYPPTFYRVALNADNYSEKIVKIAASAEPRHSLLRTYTTRNSSPFTTNKNSFQASNTILLIPTAILFHIHVDSAKWLPFCQRSDEMSYVRLFLTLPKHNIP